MTRLTLRAAADVYIFPAHARESTRLPFGFVIPAQLIKHEAVVTYEARLCRCTVRSAGRRDPSVIIQATWSRVSSRLVQSRSIRRVSFVRDSQRRHATR